MKIFLNFFVWAKIFLFVSKIFSEILREFSEIQQKMKRKSFYKPKIQKKFACGGLKPWFLEQFGDKTIIWVRKFCENENIFVSAKPNKRTLIGSCVGCGEPTPGITLFSYTFLVKKRKGVKVIPLRADGSKKNFFLELYIFSSFWS